MSFAIHKTPVVLKRMFPQLTWHRSVPTDKKIIYLTFDDGPIPELSEYVQELLQTYNAKATFFCVGDNIRKHRTQFDKIVKGGHRIGNHTYHHVKGWKLDQESYLQEIKLCETEMQNAGLDQTMELFRPPYGQIKPGQIPLVLKHYEVIMWSVLSYDFDKHLNPYRAIKQCIKHTRSGSIVVFHENYKAEKNLKTILPAYLQHFSDKGYTFASL